MNITLPVELSKQVERELVSGRFQSPGELIEQAVKQFLDDGHRGQRRLESLRRIGDDVDRAGFYERVAVPGQ